MLEANAGARPCCCEELKFIFEEKEAKLSQLSNYWRTKTQQLISMSQQDVLKLKNQQQNLHDNANYEIQQMKKYLEAVINNILKKQGDLVTVYNGQIKSQQKENKLLVKRIVQHRNQANTSSGVVLSKTK